MNFLTQMTITRYGRSATINIAATVLESITMDDPFQKAMPCFIDKNPASKTEYIWILRSNYGYGWEDESAAETRKEILQTLKEYRQNCPQGQYRIVGRREVKQQYQ